jgi:LysM repeat protein
MSSTELNIIKASKRSNYGSLRKDTSQTTSAFIVNYRHTLNPGETLQGLSLRYGVPVESIKRANRLWSNDLAIIKDVLLVPMSREKLVELNLNDNETVPSSFLAYSDLNKNARSQKDSTWPDAVNDTNVQNSEYNIDEYLNKYDTFLNESKLKLKSLENDQNKPMPRIDDNL